jgi:DNA-binding transcriptional LysR family regulator
LRNGSALATRGLAGDVRRVYGRDRVDHVERHGSEPAAAIEGIELRHLRAFVVLGEEMHFGRAAMRLNVAQSTLSRTLADLEDHVGARLIERTQRTLGLTDAGRALLTGAAEALVTVGASVGEVRAGDRRPLMLGVLNSLGYRWVARLRRELAVGGATLEVRPMTLRDGFEPLRGAIDAAVVALPIAPPSNLGFTPLGLVEPWVALPSGHRHARDDQVAVGTMASEPLIIPASHAIWEQNFELIARAQGLDLRYAPNSPTMWEVLSRVAAGEGWSISASRADFHPWEGVALRPAVGIERVRVAAVWDGMEPTARARRLVDGLVAAAARSETDLPAARASRSRSLT